MLRKMKNLPAGESGIVLVFVAIGMLVFCGFAALAVDIGHLQVVRNEIQKAADAGALAGARGLWPDNIDSDNNAYVSIKATPNWPVAQQRAQAVIQSAYNAVDKSAIDLANVTIKAIRWDYKTETFAEDNTNPNGVRVAITIQTDRIKTFFTRVVNYVIPDQSATAIAVMDYVNSVGPGCLPIAINKRFAVKGQSLFINFTPDPLDNGGWFADPPDKASAVTFRDYIDNASCPALEVGEYINLQNGQDTSVLDALADKLAKHDEGYWDTYLPVVNTNQFNQQQPIIAFLPFRITSVSTTGNEKGVTGTVLGTAMAAYGEPGASDSTMDCLLLSAPKLVS